MTNKLILVGGVPGSGKTYIGKELSKARSVYIDKDTITKAFTEKLLEALGSHKDDRESDVYTNHVRAIEYEIMMKHAFENLGLHNNVVCSAPFIAQFNDDKWVKDVEFKSKISDGKLIKIWIHVDEKTARDRILARGADRDNGKLSNWDNYVTQVQHAPPSNVENLIVIDNTPSSNIPLSKQLESVIRVIESNY